MTATSTPSLLSTRTIPAAHSSATEESVISDLPSKTNGVAPLSTATSLMSTLSAVPAAPPAAIDATPEVRRIVSVGFEGPRTVGLFSDEEGPLGEGQFDVDTLFSGISAGTELTQFRGSNPYLHGWWDERLKLFIPTGETRSGAAHASQSFPVRVTGYMEVGCVAASRSPAVREGELVCMAYGHKSGHRADARRDFFVVLPETIDPILGIYVAQMGPICANGILH